MKVSAQNVSGINSRRGMVHLALKKWWVLGPVQNYWNCVLNYSNKNNRNSIFMQEIMHVSMLL